ncbi:rmuC family protein [Orientia tsutsugamushi str. Sido]|nr:rmuC family protein [Orientia tsutsugamushi str. Sido]
MLAEITLENILKASGLRVKYDFIMQCNLTDENNMRLRPDALIFLPGII